MPTFPVERNDDITEAQRKSFAERVAQSMIEDETAAAEFTDPYATTDSESRRDEGSYLPFLSPPQRPDEIGRLNGYRVLRQLGEGGMGLVFEAEDTKLMRRVALKVMKPEVAVKEQHRMRFIREAQTAAAVEHDHICPIYEVGEENGVPFIAMPFLKGEPLDVYLKRMKPLDVADAIRIGREVALGLFAAHEAGLVHRDIKPANVWLETRPNGQSRARILDFGLARGLVDDVQVTASGAILGTPAYMAPEQARGKPVDRRADLFSLGVMLYEMTTGRRPFTGGDTMAILTSLAVDDPTMPHLINPAVSVEFSRLIMSLLSKMPEKRPASGRVVSEALLGILARTSRPIVEAIPGDAVSPQTPNADATAVVDWQELDEPEPVEDRVSRDAKALRSGAPSNNKRSAPETLRVAASRRLGRPLIVAIGLALLIGGGFAVYKLAFQTRDGTLLVEVDGTADLRFKNGELQIFGADGKLKYTLKPGERSKTMPPGKYTVQVVSADGVKLNTDAFEMGKDGKVTLRVTAEAVAVAKKPQNPTDAADVARRADAEAAFPALQAKFKAADVTFASFAKDVSDFKATHGGTPAAIKAADLLMKLPSPLDVLDASKIPDDAKAAWKASSFDGKDVVGVLGEHRRRLWRSGFPIALRPDGKELACAGDGRIRLLEFATGNVKAEFEAHTAMIMWLTYAPRQDLLVTCGQDNTAKLWDVSQRPPKCIHVFEGFTKTVWGVAFNRQENVLAITSEDGTIQFWDVRGKLPVKTAETKNDGPAYEAAFSPDGKLFVCGGQEALNVWDIVDGKLVPKPEWRMPGSAPAAAFAPDGTWLAATGPDNSIRIWDLTGPQPKERDRLIGHTKYVERLAVSPDGSRLVSLAFDGTVRLWDLSTKKELLIHKEWGGFCFAQGGKTVCIGGSALRLWDLATGKEVQPLTGTIGPARHVAISPDGTNVLVSDESQTYLLEAGTGKVVSTFTATRADFAPDERLLLLSGGPQPVRLVERESGKEVLRLPVTNALAALSPDSGRVVAWTGSTLSVWDAKTGQQLRSFESPEGQAFVNATVTPDGRRLFANCLTWVLWWDMDTGKEIRRIPLGEHLRGSAALPTGSTVTGTHMGGVLFWDWRTDKPSRTLPGPTNGYGVAGSLDGRHLVCAGGNGQVIVWDVNSGKRLYEWQLPGPVNSVAFAADGRHIAIANANGTVYILRIAQSPWYAEKELNALQTRLADPKADRESLRKDLLSYRVKYAGFPEHTVRAAELLAKLPSPLDALDPTKIPDDAKAAWKVSGFDGRDVVAALGEHRQRQWAAVTRVAYHQDGRTFATAGQDGVMTLWATASTTELRTIRAHSQYITAMAFRPGAQVLATCAHDGGTRLWDVNTGKLIHAFGGHAGVTALAFSADGKVLATGGTGDHSIHLWDVETHKFLRTLTGHKGWVMGLAFSGKDLVLASGSRDGSVRLWDGESGKELRTLIRQEEPGLHDWQVAFSPDGQKLAAVHPISGLKMWVTATGAELASLSGLSTVAVRLGDRPVLLSRDGADLKLWDLSTKKEQLTIKGAACVSAAFSPDARRILSGHTDGAVRLWDVETGKEVRPLTGSVALAVAFSPDGGSLLVGRSGPMCLLDVVKGKELRSFDLVDAANVSFSHNGWWPCSVRRDGSIRLHDVTTGAEVRNFRGFPNNPYSVALFPDQTRLLVGTDSGYAIVWDIINAIETLRLDVSTAGITDVDVSPDGRSALCTGTTTKLFDLKTGKLLQDVSPNGFQSLSAKFSPDGKTIAVSTTDGRIILQDAVSGNKLQEWQFPGPVRSLGFASDGRHIATANGNGTVYVLRLPPRLESIDPDRATAEWVISNGSAVGIQVDGKDVPVGKGKELPTTPFQVVSLNLNRNKLVNDETLACMNGLRHLTHAQITNCAAGDKTLAYIKDCKNLETLILYASQVTDAGLEVVAGFKKLKNLNITQLPVSEAAVKKLAAAIPQCRIAWNGGTIEPTQTAAPGGKFALQFDTSSTSVSLPGVQVDLAKTGSFELWLEWHSAKGSAIPLFLTGKDQVVFLQTFEKDTVQLVVMPKNLGVGQKSDELIWKTKLPAGSAHIAASWSQGNYVLFVNGKPIDGRIEYKYSLPANLRSTIGMNPADPLGPATPPSEAMLNISHLRISSDARFTKEFVPDKRFAPDAGTVALYLFDEGQGDVLKDSSGNNHHGKIVGAKWVKAD